jgi:hypothetical protein
MSNFFKQISKILIVLFSLIIILITGFLILNPINSTKNLLLFNPFLNKPNISYKLLNNNYSLKDNCNKLYGAIITYSSSDKYFVTIQEDFTIPKGEKVKIGISCIYGSFTNFNVSLPTYIELN